MVRLISLTSFLCLVLTPRIGFAAPQDKAAAKPPADTSPVVAKGNGITITADEVKARMTQQAQFGRSPAPTDRKKVVEDLVSFEVVAREAEKAGMDRDPDVKKALRRIMAQKLMQKKFQESGAEKEVPEPELKSYYDSHMAEFTRPKRVTISQILFKGAPGSKERAFKTGMAKLALIRFQEISKQKEKAQTAFADVARQLSEDTASKGRGGEVGAKSQEDLEKLYSKEIADKLFSMKPGEVTEVVESPAGLHVFKVNAFQEGSVTPFDTAKRGIAVRLGHERKNKEIEAWVKQLRDAAGVTIDDAALEKIVIAPPPTRPGMPGMPPHGPGGPGPMVSKAPPGAPPAGPRAPGAPAMSVPPPPPPAPAPAPAPNK